ncbi:MAG: homoserine dehydrogenase [Oscillospiraceae bacterium]|nr:homoserine dehydrogenase [Oscillospiraceae bacterium]
MRIAVLGHGVIGRHVCATLEASPAHELKWILERPGLDTEPKMTSDVGKILSDPEVELVCDILPGTHPSYEYMKMALEAGKHVVTVNKAALCFGFKELVELAERNGLFLRYEAACGGTIPDIAETLKLAQTNEIEAIYGIMNGTTNFIIDKMNREGAEFEPTLREAQRLGYAEADPTADLSGFDVKNKIIIISNTAYKCYCTSEFPMCGIQHLTKELLDDFARQGKTVKLFGLSVRRGNRYAIGVAPVVLPMTALEAHVPTNFNLFTLRADKAGEIKLYGQGAGGVPTADAVVRDITAIAEAPARTGEAYFSRPMVYDPSLLFGKGYIGGTVKEGTLDELCRQALAAGQFLAFEPDNL